MSRETNFIEILRGIATHPAARGLQDDAAILEIGSETLIITHDAMAQNVHFFDYADPADVAWKLVSVNLSDLAAKGAQPLGVMLGFTLSDDDWDRQFAQGLKQALQHYDVALLGGDTINGNAGRVFGMTAFGKATHCPVPARSGANIGDLLYVTGHLGDAYAGYCAIKAGDKGANVTRLIDTYNRPHALIKMGQDIAPYATAMMDVSDGLLLDGQRMAKASGLALQIDLSKIPLSDDYTACRGDGREQRLEAASWGDDYQLLFAAPKEYQRPENAIYIGEFSAGDALILWDGDKVIPTPDNLGFQHN